MVFSMIKDRNIWIRNVYYMLAYAFEELKKNNYEQIDMRSLSIYRICLRKFCIKVCLLS